MSGFSIPHHAIVFVGDGRKALFLCNEGDEKSLSFVRLHVVVESNPSTHKQGTDRPGVVFKSANSSRRSKLETADWHDFEERRFARQVGASLEELVRARDAKAVFIVAPHRTLVELRQTLHADVKSRIRAEINKNLTKLPIVDIEKQLTR